MKIAVVSRKNSFTKYWIAYLNEKEIAFAYVDPYEQNAVSKLKDFDFLFWHVSHFHDRDVLQAKSIIDQLNGKVETFPNIDEMEYFDNKIDQIKRFEREHIKYPKTIISYSQREAEQSIKHFDFPFVAKLKKGAGSDNVWLIKNKEEAFNYIEKAFSSGFPVFNSQKYINKRLLKSKEQKNIIEGLKGVKGLLKNRWVTRRQPNEKGYTFFQEFIPNEGYDIRVVVIRQQKAFSARRDARPDGWTASGSGIASYPNEKQDTKYIKEAFSISEKLNSRCIAIDFVRDRNKDEIFAIEISPFYASYSMEPCTGYWDKSLNWHWDERDPQWFLMQETINS